MQYYGRNMFKMTIFVTKYQKKNHTPWYLVRKGTTPTERPPVVGEVSSGFCG
jgi:hypothetical protein